MKFRPLVVVIAFSVYGTCLAQTIVEEKVDEFTGNKVRRTSWEFINRVVKSEARFRISQVNDIMTFDLKIILGAGRGEVFSIKEGDELMFLMEGGEVIKLQNIEHQITCMGCGAVGLAGSERMGISVSYLLTKDAFEKLKSGTSVKLRVYTSIGYTEFELNEQQKIRLKTALGLF